MQLDFHHGLLATTINAELAEPAEKTGLFCEFCGFCVECRANATFFFASLATFLFDREGPDCLTVSFAL